MVADPLLFLEPRIGAQPEHVVVGKARATERPGEDLFLLGRRVEAKAVGALDLHGSHYTKAPCKPQTQEPDRFAVALYLPGLKAGVSRGFR